MNSDWQTKKLGEVCDILDSKRKPITKGNRTRGKYPYYGASGILDYVEDYIFDEKLVLIGEDGAKWESGEHTAFIADGKYWVNNHAHVIRPHGNIILENWIIFYFYLSDLTEHTTGITVPKLNQANLRKIKIPLPPLPEQKRIVAILDEAFEKISKAKANAEQNLKNSKELFESYMERLFENKDEGWEEKEFGKIISTLTDYHSNGSYKILKKNIELKNTEDFAWMVRSTDFENNFENEYRYINERGYNFLSKSKIFGGEIIMSKIGNAGNVYLMPKLDRPCSLAMNLFLIKLNEEKVIPEYIYHYLKSKKGEIQIKSRLKGMATKTITKDNVKNIVIPLPTLKTQQTIVCHLDSLSTETKKLETIYKKKIEDLEELKKSILQKAFAGEL